MSVSRSMPPRHWSQDSHVPVAGGQQGYCERPIIHRPCDHPTESSESCSDDETVRFEEPTPTHCQRDNVPIKPWDTTKAATDSLPSNPVILWSMAAIAFSTVSALWYYLPQNPKCDLMLGDELEKLRPQFNYLKEDDWLVLDAGIETIRDYKPHRPSTFIFAYENNVTAAERLADAVASLATQFLSDCRSNRPIKLRGSTIGDDLIHRFKDKLDQTHVMVVHGLEQMNAETASPFHSLCDQYNPVVEKSAFFFTLQVDLADGRYSASKLAKKRLLDLWKTSRDALVSGLVTRLTNNVIEINEEQ